MFYQTLSETLDKAEEYLAESKAILSEENPLREPFQFDGIRYEQTKQADYKLVSYKGKNTRKYFHISIYRTGHGQYELTCYCL